MGDRAYGNPPAVEHAQQQGADVLVRIKLSNLPLYTPAGKTGWGGTGENRPT